MSRHGAVTGVDRGTALAIALALLVLAAGAGDRSGAIDLADFGRAVRYSGDTPDTLEVHSLERGFDGWEAWPGPDGQYMMGLEFDEPRDIAQASIEFRHAISDRSLIQVQYWRNHWPTAKAGGWAPVDDPFHGEWATIKADWWAGDREVSFGFRPLNEDPQRETAPPLPYRRTYRLRFVLGDRELPPVRFLHAYGPQPAVEGQFEIQRTRGSPLRLPLDASVVNGLLLEGPNRSLTTLMPLDEEPALLRVRYASEDLLTPTRTVVTLRSTANEQQGVSFLPAEAARSGSIRVPSLGVTVVCRSAGETPATAPRETTLQHEAATSVPAGPPVASIYDRVAGEPEQTYGRARREAPELSPTKPALYVPLGPPEARQELAVHFGGSAEINRSALKVPADDGQAAGGQCVLRLRTGEPPVHPAADGKVELRRLDGYLPVVIQKWQVGDATYEQTSLASYLQGEPRNPRGDEEVVLLARLSITNNSQRAASAAVRLTWTPAARLKPDHRLNLHEGFVSLTPGVPDGSASHLFFVRGTFQVEAPGEEKPADTLVWSTELAPGRTEVLEWRVPFGMPSGERKPELAGLDFEKVLAFEADRWRQRVGRMAGLNVSDPLLNDFLKSTLVNLWITADRDPFNGMAVLPAGTYRYSVCLNESCMQIRSLDMRGLHEDAQIYLDAILRGQSTRALQGRFTDRKGVFLGMPTQTGDYQTFNYNLDHGFVLWTLAEHYRFTRDRKWLERAAPAMVEGCDFITRQSAWKPDSNTLTREDRHWGIGLLPPGHLEDPPEWLWWFAVNAYAWRGMRSAAEVLREIDHPDAARLARESVVFGDNLRRSCRESMLRAPVVRLRDGTYVPFQPTRSRLRGRDLGWIRDALYGPIHLIDCGVYPPDSPEAEWILRDAEDNVFIGGERGYELTDYETQWFSWGGRTLQPCLLPVPTVYQDRGMRKHALRAFYNTLCASLFADARCFAEWVPRPGTAGGPLFKPPDESAFVIWLRELLVRERGDDLDLLACVPAEWLQAGRHLELRNAPTWFGPINMRVQSAADVRQLTVELEGPRRNPPEWIRVHAGALGRVTGVTLDGKELRDFDAGKGLVEITGKAGKARLVISY